MMTGVKRSFGDLDLDPDYQDVTEFQQKRQKLLESDAKESTVRKIEDIIKKHFSQEIQNKDSEIDLIDQTLHKARHMLDRLRACIVASYYSRAGQMSGQLKPSISQPPIIHPAVKKLLGKSLPESHGPVVAPPGGGEGPPGEQQTHYSNGVNDGRLRIAATEHNGRPVPSAPRPTPNGPSHPPSSTPSTSMIGRASRLNKHKKRVVVGNLSKYIPVDRRDDNDQATHKWMVYVRGPRDTPDIDDYVDKVWFFLHPTYRPNDLVEITQAPFHLTRRGWGEFPVRIQLHFKDSRNKRVDIIHHLKLDKTYTGLQTLGSETHIDIEIERPRDALIPPPHTIIPPPPPITPVMRTSTPTPNQPITTPQPDPVTMTSPPVSSVTSHNTSLDVSAEIKQEMDSENSLGVVWEREKQSIMGNGDVLLSSGAFKDLSTVTSPPPSARLPRARTPSKLQISRSLTPQGWTRLQIKQDENESTTSSGYGTAQTPEIKEEPVDDSYPRPSGRPPTTPRAPHRDPPPPGFSPVSTETSQSSNSNSGWTHVQIKSEPVTPDRPRSAASTNQTTPETPPSTPDRVVRFELGRNMSPGIKLNVADHKNLLRLERDNNKKEEERLKVQKPVPTPVVSSSRVTTKPTSVTLGAQGFAQLGNSTGRVVENKSTALVGGASNLKRMLTQEISAAAVTQTTTSSSSPIVTVPRLMTASGGVLKNTVSPRPVPQVPILSPVVTAAQQPSPRQVPGQENVYIQCMDTSGNVFLIPQTMLKTQQQQQHKPKTTVVGSGPNKATLTYMLSPPGAGAAASNAEAKKVLKPTQDTKIQIPLQGQGQIQQNQKLVVLPGNAASGGRQMALLQQKPTNQSQVVLRDQAGNVQVVQMLPPGEKKVPTRVPEGSVRLPVQGSPNKSVIIPKDAIGQLQHGQLLQIQMPAGKAAGDTANVATVVQQQSKSNNESAATSEETSKVSATPSPGVSLLGSGQVLLQSDSSSEGKKLVALGTPPTAPGKSLLTLGNKAGTLKPQGAVSLLRPGLILNKPAVSTSLIATETAQKSDETEPAKPTTVGQSILKPTEVTTAAQVLQQQKQEAAIAAAAAAKMKKSTPSQPMYLSTKIGNQTYFLKIEQPQAGNAAALKKTEQSPVIADSTPTVTTAAAVNNKLTSSVPRDTNGVVSASSQVAAPAAEHSGTGIRHGSILGIGRSKDDKRQQLVVDINIDSYPDLTSVVASLVRKFPVVREGVDRSVHPYCAHSEGDYLQWNVGKRRAAEWQRARCIRRRIVSALKGSDSYHGDRVWSTKEIMVWCRHRCHTPLDAETSRGLSRLSSPLPSQPSSRRPLSTYTHHQGAYSALSSLSPGGSTRRTEDEEEDVDVVNDDSPLTSPLAGSNHANMSASPVITDVISPSPLAQYVTATASEIGVSLPSAPVPLGNGSCLLAALSQEVIVSAMKNFTEVILREAAAAQFSDKRVPEQLSADDILQSINSVPRADFLSNRNLGTRPHHIKSERGTH